MSGGWKIRTIKWLAGAVVAVTVLYALIVFVGAALFVYGGGTRIAPELVLKERFGKEAADVSGLVGEGDSWIDYHAWLAFTAQGAELKVKGTLGACAEPAHVSAFFGDVLRRHEPARNEPAELVTRYQEALAQGGWECKELQTGTSQAGSWWMYQPATGIHLYRAWQF